MEKGEYGQKARIVAVYSDFMTRIAQFDELVSTGSQLLVSFQQAFGFLRRVPIDKTSKLMQRIINANGSRRVLSYFKAGCANSHDSVQNMSKQVHTCHLGLQDYIRKAKVVIDELEFLLDNATSVLQTSKEMDEDISYIADSCITSNGHTVTENDKDISCNLDFCTTSIDQGRPDSEDYAIMAIIYHMVKQDYTMQHRIVSSLNHKSSQEELETYCQMWSLRPFVDDEIMRKAWDLVPGC